MSGLFTADEQPVLRAELGGPDCVLHPVVVEGDRAVIQEDLQLQFGVSQYKILIRLRRLLVNRKAAPPSGSSSSCSRTRVLSPL